jgi:glutathione synthase/RimK-type ligase-like ATP-grasp enzyme
MPGALVESLRADGHEPRVVVVDGGLLARLSPRGSSLEPTAWGGAEPGDVVVTRSRHPLALALLCQAEAQGCIPVNSWAASAAVRNKVRCTLALAARDVPVPETVLLHRPVDAARLPKESFPILLKPFQGDNGNGILLVRHPGELATIDWQEPIALAQAFLETGGTDLKLYVADQEVWGVRTPSPLFDADRPQSASP